jgi:hypothetical protein
MRQNWRNQLITIPRLYGSTLKSISKTRSVIGELLTDQKDPSSIKTDDDKEKAEILAEFFQGVLTTEPNDMAPILSLKEAKFKMIEMKITEVGIAKILTKLKIDKSIGPDTIHPRILKEIAVFKRQKSSQKLEGSSD